MAISKHNKNVTIFKHTPAPDAPYEKLSHLYEVNGPDKEYALFGFYINTKGKYGPQAVCWTRGCYVNLPDHMLDEVKKIMDDPEDVKQINEGHAAFKIYEYQANNRKGYSVKLIDKYDEIGSTLDISADDLPF